MGTALLAASLTGLATGLGAIPFLFVSALPRRAYDGILGLGAGLMLAAATLGLLGEALSHLHTPEGIELGRLVLIIFGFVAGVGVAATMDRFIPHRHAGGHHQHLGHEPGHDHHDPQHEVRRGYAVVGALSLHRVPEGLAIGAGFALDGGTHLGWLLAIAVGIQNACEGVVMAAPLRQGGLSPGRALLTVTLTGLAIPLGALAGQLLASAATLAMPFVLALAAGTLIFITSNEIIPESHSHGHEGTASSGVALGFLLTMLLQALLH
ncbi:MAG TPA: ZIP family metal transporter [Polyangia bacterium]|jgi:ZIP family zinc transporter